mmetsp:Transcript_18554/g.53653  ORF Transcript_18554/g.53653 Transcript_18554/m.53653 type:complete len:256 (-) Transcript_18554:52-819(-)
MAGTNSTAGWSSSGANSPRQTTPTSSGSPLPPCHFTKKDILQGWPLFRCTFTRTMSPGPRIRRASGLASSTVGSTGRNACFPACARGVARMTASWSSPVSGMSDAKLLALAYRPGRLSSLLLPVPVMGDVAATAALAAAARLLAHTVEARPSLRESKDMYPGSPMSWIQRPTWKPRTISPAAFRPMTHEPREHELCTAQSQVASHIVCKAMGSWSPVLYTTLQVAVSSPTDNGIWPSTPSPSPVLSTRSSAPVGT